MRHDADVSVELTFQWMSEIEAVPIGFELLESWSREAEPKVTCASANLCLSIQEDVTWYRIPSRKLPRRTSRTRSGLLPWRNARRV
jgi:hypothetical protein